MTMEHKIEPVHCTTLDMAAPKVNATPEFLAACDKYFYNFAKPIVQQEGEKALLCFHCGEALTGLMSMILGSGGFEWGIVHGEGRCAGCHWPARANHYAKKEDGTELFTLTGFVLCYHPDNVEMKTIKRKAKGE